MMVSPISSIATPGSADPAIEFDAVSMRYYLYYGGRPQLQEYLAALVSRRSLRREVWALRDVSLQVARGEVLGLCGSNGSGKSTLLKIVARILHPSSGRVIVRGRVAPLIELGAGFQPDLTGRENILLKSAILGYAEHDTRRRIDRIVDFAGLREFIDAPVRTYSSGMVARLAFAIATDVQPDVLILDEVLAVGDAEFRERSEDRIAELRRAGATVLIVSHNSAALRRICDRVAWFAYGRLQMAGDPVQVIRAYEGGLRAHADDDLPASVTAPQPTVLRPDSTFFLLELPGAGDTPLGAAIAAQFAPEHISPFRSRGEFPQQARIELARFRMLRGAFFYDQVTRLLQRPPVCAIELPALFPPTGPARWQSVAHPVTRLLGQQMAHTTQVSPPDAEYLAQPVGQAEFATAGALLDRIAFVGLADRPRESLLLLWYTFGWPPDALPAPLAPTTTAESVALSEFDSALYERAVRRFELQFALMAQDLVEREGGPLAERLEPPYPLELLHGLLHARYERLQRGQGRRALRFTFDRPVPGTGWYGVEYSPQHGTYRWTGPEPTATIQLPIDRALVEVELLFRCRILLASRPSLLRTLRFTINGWPIPVEQRRSWDDSIICEGVIPRAALVVSPFALITIAVDRTEVPAATSVEHRETRQLGVALSWLELTERAAAEAPVV